MNIFLTGSNGYIGKNFLIEASKRGHKIFAVTRKLKNKKINNVKWLVGPIDKKWAELKEAHVLVHLATAGADDQFSNFEKCFKFNVVRSLKMIDNAFKSGCKKWLIVSTYKEKMIKSLKFDQRLIKNKQTKVHYAYALTKAIFSKNCIKYSLKKNIKCRIITLYQVYGGANERSKRLWPALIKAAKNNDNFNMTTGNQITDFNYIENVITGLLQALDFNKKGKKFPQRWEMRSGKTMPVKKFAKIIWKKINPKSKIVFSKIKIYDKNNYKISSKNIWKIKYTSPENSFRYENI
jgi:nucleoside-diphosphate-sugar epimerase